MSERESSQATPQLPERAEADQKPELTPEKKAAIERALAMLRKGLPLGVTRPFTRDEMHER